MAFVLQDLQSAANTLQVYNIISWIIPVDFNLMANVDGGKIYGFDAYYADRKSRSIYGTGVIFISNKILSCPIDYDIHPCAFMQRCHLYSSTFPLIISAL